MGIALSLKPVRPMNLGVLSIREFPRMEQECAVWVCGPSWFMVMRASVGFSHRSQKFAIAESFGLMRVDMDPQFWL